MRFSKGIATLLLAVSLTIAGGALPARAQTTPPPAGDKASYFVLDFNDGTASPAAGFQYDYATSQSLSATNLIQALAAATIAPKLAETHTDYGGSLGYYYTAFGYGAHAAAATSDFGYGWTFYTSTDGVTWTSPSLGASSTSVSGATPWVSFSYGPTGYTNTGNPIAPPPATTLASFVTVNAAATPEPGTVALLGTGLAFGGAIVARRTRRK